MLLYEWPTQQWPEWFWLKHISSFRTHTAVWMTTYLYAWQQNSHKLHIYPNQGCTEENSNESILWKYCNQQSTGPLALQLNVQGDMQQHKNRLHKRSHNYLQLVFLALHCVLQISDVRCQRFNKENVQNDVHTYQHWLFLNQNCREKWDRLRGCKPQLDPAS